MKYRNRQWDTFHVIGTGSVDYINFLQLGKVIRGDSVGFTKKSLTSSIIRRSPTFMVGTVRQIDRQSMWLAYDIIYKVKGLDDLYPQYVKTYKHYAKFSGTGIFGNINVRDTEKTQGAGKVTYRPWK